MSTFQFYIYLSTQY